MNLKYLKIFLILISLVLIEIYIQYKQNLLGLSQKIFSRVTYESQKCEPFHFASKNYRVKIDDIIYPQAIPLNLNKSINFECLNSQEKIKKILFWTPFFGDPKFAFGLGVKEPFKQNLCPVYNCETFNDRSRVNEADIVIVHMRDTIPDIPKNRPKNQRWIFTVFESPMHCSNFTRYNNIFNFTSTYRIDAEFPRLTGSYQLFEWEENLDFDENKDFSKGKTHFAAGVVGNCGGSSARLEYINELQKYVNVTLLGKCKGGKKCTDYFPNSSDKDCKELVSKSHKFYLSFENSICDGYISEKFFFILKYDIIPVVLGGGNHSFFIPKSGFINVLDYKSPKNLADYLIYLDSNKTAYNSYFKWKKYVKFKDQLVFSNFCDMCIQLNLENYVPIWKNVISDIGKLWSKRDNCKIGKIDSKNNFLLENFTGIE
ncbi:unnamed protein product [Brachionus calyciflorus]|uniref:Fucosyltransferase n=1 Tax=Brachionus calyciflorus TaxID=104777 RepID=A0A813XXX6_9BILA|nr:unnamed protein product [Brachionus calyciflorus]